MNGSRIVTTAFTLGSRKRAALIIPMCAAFVAYQPALADPPERVVLPPPGEFSVGDCGTPVDALITGNVTLTIRSDGSLLVHVAADSTLTLTNPATDASVTVKGNGPGNVSADGSFAGTGQSVIFGPTPGFPDGIYSVRGHFVADAQGVVSVVDGLVTNLCSLVV